MSPPRFFLSSLFASAINQKKRTFRSPGVAKAKRVEDVNQDPLFQEWDLVFLNNDQPLLREPSPGLCTPQLGCSFAGPGNLLYGAAAKGPLHLPLLINTWPLSAKIPVCYIPRVRCPLYYLYTESIAGGGRSGNTKCSHGDRPGSSIIGTELKKENG